MTNKRGGAHHVPDPQDDGSCADMAAQTAAGGVPALPRGDRHLLAEHVSFECVSRNGGRLSAVPSPCAERGMTNRIRAAASDRSRYRLP